MPVVDWTYASGAMEIGRGYAVTTNGLPPSPGNYSDNSNVFSGALNTGDITVTLYKNNNEINDNNWNFIGNPYPSAISVDDFFSANIADVPLNPNVNGLTDGAIFLWSQSQAPDANNNGNEQINFAQSDYAIINRMTQTAGSSGITPLRYIPSGQGFFVALTENLGAPVNSVTSSDIVFTNSMRRTGDNTQFFGPNDTVDNKSSDLVYEKNILWLNLTSDNGVFSQMAFGYANGATDTNDGWGYDTPRNLSTGIYATLYSTIDASDGKFAIQGKSPESLNTNEIIPIGFLTSIEEATLYKFSLAQIEGSFLNGNPIYLKDKLLNKTHNLKDSDYTFTSEVGEFNNRFEIVFSDEALDIDEVKVDANTLQIIELPNGDVQFKVSSQFEMKSIEIVDLLGRTLYKLNAEGSSQTFSLPNLSQAPYLAKVQLNNGYVITKKALKHK
jgi:3-isopropylmalate dehydratase small subunit